MWTNSNPVTIVTQNWAIFLSSENYYVLDLDLLVYHLFGNADIDCMLDFFCTA